MPRRFTTHIGVKKVTVRADKTAAEVKELSAKINDDLKKLAFQAPERTFEDHVVLLAINAYSQIESLTDELDELKQQNKQLQERQHLLEQEYERDSESEKSSDDDVTEISDDVTELNDSEMSLSESKEDESSSTKSSMLTHRPVEKKSKSSKKQAPLNTHAYNPKRLQREMSQASQQLNRLRQTPRS